jgi:hypothetical protein
MWLFEGGHNLLGRFERWCRRSGNSRAIKIVQRATSGALNFRKAPKWRQSCA